MIEAQGRPHGCGTTDSDDVTRFRHTRAKVVLIGTGVLMTVSLIALGTSLFGDDSAEMDARAGRLVTQLDGDRATAQRDLKAKHEKLLADLSRGDTRRTDRDKIAGRSVLLGLTEATTATPDVRQAHELIRSRYPFLLPSSRVLTEFIPDWTTATGVSPGHGTYTLGAFDVDVSDIRGPDHGYVGMARLDPATAPTAGTPPSEYVLVGYRTQPDGAVSAFEASRVSNRTRDAVAATDRHRSGTTAPTLGTEPHTGG